MQWLESLNLYLIVKTLHVIALVCWMAMLFYLPRLFVYHAQNAHKKEFVEVVKIQEMRLYKYIGLPAIVGTLLTGIAMIALNPSWLKVADSGLWLHIKIVFILILVAYHLACGYFIKTLGDESCTKSHKFFRVFNEIPTLLLIIIVFLAIYKPL
uniref:Protoporphyrinogen IX oxidase n=1 Tax=uncultured Helicobacter sp. TaxID=175537 RepID=A0A650EM46_9HELI|nr:UPF0093 membrane protein [uncultured Helicobacter sp.]